MAFRFLGLLLLPWTLQPGGGQKLQQLDAPILVTLAGHKLRLTCAITSPPSFKTYVFSYYQVDLKGRQSNSVGEIYCPRSSEVENKTHTEVCTFNLTALRDASATGTYYCRVMWKELQMTGNGTFILVRDTEYKEPPEGSKKLLLFTFTGLLTALSILGTGLVLWKAKIYPCPMVMKTCRWPARKILRHRDPGPAQCSVPKPDQSGSIYTALQHHQSEVYDCLQSDVSTPPSEWSSPSQGQHQAGADESNAIYENF